MSNCPHSLQHLGIFSPEIRNGLQRQLSCSKHNCRGEALKYPAKNLVDKKVNSVQAHKHSNLNLSTYVNNLAYRDV